VINIAILIVKLIATSKRISCNIDLTPTQMSLLHRMQPRAIYSVRIGRNSYEVSQPRIIAETDAILIPPCDWNDRSTD